jgi:hypothetical protein
MGRDVDDGTAEMSGCAPLVGEIEISDAVNVGLFVLK